MTKARNGILTLIIFNIFLCQAQQQQLEEPRRRLDNELETAKQSLSADEIGEVQAEMIEESESTLKDINEDTRRTVGEVERAVDEFSRDTERKFNKAVEDIDDRLNNYQQNASDKVDEIAADIERWWNEK